MCGSTGSRMAENNQRKIADPINFNDDDDPFAELTRIMGFDPRVSALGREKESAALGGKSVQPAVVTPIAPKVAATPTKAAPAPVARTTEPVAPEAAAHDDFGIDLEKELLGEFADFEAPQEVSPAPVSWQV